MEQEHKVLTWADFDRSIWDLAQRITANSMPHIILYDRPPQPAHQSRALLRASGRRTPTR